MKIVRIHQGKSFPLWLRLMIVLLTFVLTFLVFKNIKEPWSIIVAMILSMFPPTFWFATKIFEIDISRKTLFQGSWAMGFRSGKWTDFENLSFELKKVKIKPTEFSLPQKGNVITDTEYQAYLKTNSDQQFYLFGHPLKEGIEKKIKTLNKKLGLTPE